MPLLEATGLEAAYSGRVALAGLSVALDGGQIMAVLGPNGAGKTTLLRSLAGLLPGQPRQGRVLFAGRDITKAHPERIARLGVVLVPEARGLFHELSVRENLEVALFGRERSAAQADLALVHGLFPILEEREAQRAEALSGGEQQMLALSRALLRRPQLLLLDEPSRGLAPEVARALFDALSEIARRGTAILLVEQNALLAKRVAHQVAILEAGRIVTLGPPEDPKLNAAVRGSDREPNPPREARGTDRPRRLAMLAALLAAIVAPLALQDVWIVRATLIFVYAVAVLGQNLLLGYAGQVSFGQAGFLAVGAYAFAHLRATGLPFLLALASAGVAAALAGLAVGLPSVRLKGPYLAIATLGFGGAVYQLLASGERLSGGREGLPVAALAFAGGLPRTSGLYYVSLAIAITAALASKNLLCSYVGRALVALRDDDLAASSQGINLYHYKLLAFALSSFLTGVSGALLAQFLGHLEPQGFTIAESITLVVATVVGGLASLEGSILGAAFVVLLPAFGSGLAWFTPVAYGLGLIVVLTSEPGGLAGRLRRIGAARGFPRRAQEPPL
jgi:ABC-type branched-subunit amino acid transport system ATPase component/ABC-type branched-subunit amino acid transport system permease subunit